MTLQARRKVGGQLKTIRNKILPISEDGGDNRGAITAQIDVVNNDLSEDDIYLFYEEDAFVLQAALQVRKWIDGDGEEGNDGIMDRWNREVRQ